jgi:cytochrome c-type biogenesis protein
MTFGLETLILLPIALGLLGFIEPCTIGGHLLFLETQKSRSAAEKTNAVMIFIAARAGVAGLFGAFIAFVGQKLIGLQTGIWLIFGAIYLTIGLAFILGRAGLVKQRINFAPMAWRQAKNPLVLGLAFGLNIPACAAPILFGLLGLAATTGTIMSGFWMMALFGLALSVPLVVFAANASLAAWLDRFGQKLKNMGWVIGTVFVLLGAWSIWFGLFVDPEDWSGLQAYVGAVT